ncbi:uncharacterized protein PAC_03407 [Phialocephala subalpina]|uniref:Zn(2)-C6 fungal-type domain-containing protein n=1 Tax=Phialocephala subalpina TaxID=576137 RepID=A0A1L7WL88_9HELO|nr:uncharacterized protein PAC_03407 [Phialocephala subalpina]
MASYFWWERGSEQLFGDAGAGLTWGTVFRNSSGALQCGYELSFTPLSPYLPRRALLPRLQMKAKACARCRQSKLRCDSDVKAPEPCTRCQAIKTPCVLDREFQRVSKSRRLVELEAEVTLLRRNAAAAAAASASEKVAENNNTPSSNPSRPPPTTQTSQPPQQQSWVLPTAPSCGSCLQDKSLANVHLTAAQVTEAFRVFLIQCHPYLDLSIPTSPEAIYEKCPLLFWVICAVASSTSTMLELQPGIQGLVGQLAVNPPRSIEVVQALLTLCMWPFPFYSTLSDPSFLYCGMATQIGLQIGLHKPSLSQEFSSRREVLEVDDNTRKTTWMACYVVNQMQTGRLGVPLTIHADYTFLQALETPGLSPSLVSLCRIARLTAQFTTTIGANAQNLSGLLDPPTRIDMVRFFSAELESLRNRHFPEMNQVVEVSFLTSRLHLWSFILHDDVPRSPDVIEWFYQATKDAAALILLASEKNLSRCPFHLARSVLYSALTLLKIVSSSYATEPKVIFDQIMLASRTLASAVKIEDDHAQRWSRHLQQLLGLRDRKHTPAIRSRMAASLVYDAIRIMKEHVGAGPNDGPTYADPEGAFFPALMNIENAEGLFDVDGLNWDDIMGLL